MTRLTKTRCTKNQKLIHRTTNLVVQCFTISEDLRWKIVLSSHYTMHTFLRIIISPKTKVVFNLRGYFTRIVICFSVFTINRIIHRCENIWAIFFFDCRQQSSIISTYNTDHSKEIKVSYNNNTLLFYVL